VPQDDASECDIDSPTDSKVQKLHVSCRSFAELLKDAIGKMAVRLEVSRAIRLSFTV